MGRGTRAARAAGNGACPPHAHQGDIHRLAARRHTTKDHRELMPAQYIFTIESLSKAFGKKDVLKNIWLAFYPGAKIGVSGANGSGKTTLLRTMAGIDKDFIGTARPASGISIGFVPQEPQLDPNLDVRCNVELAVAPMRAPLARFDEINARLGEGP